MPECVRAYLRGAGYSTRALEDMEPHVREWDRWMRAVGKFYDYGDADGFEWVYQVHRRTIMPAMPDPPSSVRRAVVRKKVLLLALPYELRARALFSPHDASPSLSLSAGLYAASGTTFSSRVYGMPQSVRVSSKSVMKQLSAWPSTMSAASASEWS